MSHEPNRPEHARASSARCFPCCCVLRARADLERAHTFVCTEYIDVRLGGRSALLRHGLLQAASRKWQRSCQYLQSVPACAARSNAGWASAATNLDVNQLPRVLIIFKEVEGCKFRRLQARYLCVPTCASAVNTACSRQHTACATGSYNMALGRRTDAVRCQGLPAGPRLTRQWPSLRPGTHASRSRR